MWKAKSLGVYLAPQELSEVMAGEIPFLQLLRDVLQARGWRVRFEQRGLVTPVRAFRRPGYAMVQMSKPWHKRVLYLRRSYAASHWRIEASDQRAEWSTTRAVFSPDGIDPDAAATCFAHWRQETGADDVPHGPREDFIYVPLQGRLTVHRAFQSMSPVNMVHALRKAFPDRPLRLTLHPREPYTDADRAAFSDLLQDPMVHQGDEAMHLLLARCAFVATENSSVAFHGLLHRTPAVLFADADFHHLFHSVPRSGAVRQPPPVTQASPYFEWFMNRQTLAADQADAGERLAKRLQELGLPL